jgi:hypothetical protein
MSAGNDVVVLDGARIAKTLDEIDAIGNRYHGSAGERACRDYISERFVELGLQDVHLEPFLYLGYEHESASVQVTSPEARSFECRSVQYSAVGSGEGEAVYLGTGTAEDFARVDAVGADLAGKVVVAHSIAPFMIAPFLEGRDIAALVNVGETPDGVIGNFTAALYRPPLEPPWEGRPVAYPAVTIEAQAGRELISQVTLSPGVTIRVEHAARYVEKEAHNVIGHLPGADPDAGEVVVGGHYDSQAEGPCVWDNATGIASIFEIARVLSTEPVKRTVRVIAFAIEEVGLWGSTAYTVAHADEMNRIVGMVNLDAVASAFPAKRTIWTDEAMEPFAVEASGLQSWDHELIADARAFEFSDNNPFTDAGVPSCWIWEFPPIHPYYHSSGDTRERVDPEKVAVTAAVSGQIARRLALDLKIDLGRARRREEARVAEGAA